MPINQNPVRQFLATLHLGDVPLGSIPGPARRVRQTNAFLVRTGHRNYGVRDSLNCVDSCLG
jgi:hypothetical protein